MSHETLRGFVGRIIFNSGDFFVFLFELDRDSRTVVETVLARSVAHYKVRGDFPGLDRLKEGVPLELTGVIDDTFHCAYWAPWVDSANRLYAFLTLAVPSFYERDWTRLMVNAFPADLPQRLSNNDHELAEWAASRYPCPLPDVETRGTRHLAKCIASWKALCARAEMTEILTRLGQKTTLTAKVFETLGESAAAVIREDPYQLARLGLPLGTLDQVAQRYGVAPDDARRYRGLCLAVLYQRLHEGHTVTPRANLPRLLGDLKGVKLGVVVPSALAQAVDTMAKEGWVHIDPVTQQVSLPDPHLWESESAALLHKLLASPVQDPSPVNFEAFEQESGLTLTKDQRQAVTLAQTQRAFVLTGYPGTGKTSTVRAIVRLWQLQGKRLALLAPTGIAAKRLETLTGHMASTIHRALGYDGTEWQRSLGNVDAVVVDEVGMLDAEVFYRVLDALPARAQVVFVGDPDQLYPVGVGAGAVLVDLLESNAVPVVRLTKVFRASEQGAVVKYANDLRAGVPVKPSSLNRGKEFRFVAALDGMGLDLIVKLAKALEAQGRQQQVLAAHHKGTLGCTNLNAHLQEVLNPPSESKTEVQPKETLYRQGDRVIVVENDYKLKVFNGDRGTLVFIGPSYDVLLEDGRKVGVPAKIAHEILALGYCVTVHRSQGQEWNTVILAMPPSKFLTKPLVYTAVTRAKQAVWIVGAESAWTYATQTEQPLRQTGLRELLSRGVRSKA